MGQREHRFLFTGDTIYLRDGEWVDGLLGSSDRAGYVESLELIRELDFDVLVPWAATGGQALVLADEQGADLEADRRDARADRLGRRLLEVDPHGQLVLVPDEHDIGLAVHDLVGLG